MNTKDYTLILQIKENNYLALEEFLLNHKKIIEICTNQFHLEEDLVLDSIFNIILLDKSKLKKINNLDLYIFSCMKNFRHLLNQKQKKELEKAYIFFKQDEIVNQKESTDLYFNSLLNLVDEASAKLLRLRHFNCFTLREIAKMENISKSKVDYQLKKAYKRIYNKLSKDNLEIIF